MASRARQLGRDSSVHNFQLTDSNMPWPIRYFPELPQYDPHTSIPADTLITASNPTEEFELRVERLAREYLQGNNLYIHTATLRGPFDRTWGKSQIAWAQSTLSSGANNPLSAQKSRETTLHPSTPKSIDTPNRTLEWAKATASQPRPPAPSSLLVDPNISPFPSRSDGANTVREPSDPSTRQDVQGPLGFRNLSKPAKDQARPNGVNARNPDKDPSDKTHLPSPHSSKPQVPTRSSTNEENIDHEQDEQPAPSCEGPSDAVGIPELHHAPSRKRAPRDRHCEHCDTQDTFRWVKGPSGPGKSPNQLMNSVWRVLNCTRYSL